MRFGRLASVVGALLTGIIFKSPIAICADAIYPLDKDSAVFEVPESPNSAIVKMPAGVIRVGSLIVGGGNKTISGGAMEIYEGLDLKPSESGVILDFSGGAISIKAPISGSESDVIRVSGGRVRFAGRSELFSGTIDLQSGGIGIVGVSGDEYPFGDPSIAPVKVDGGTLSADAFEREVGNQVHFGSALNAGGTVGLGELGAGTLMLSSPFPVQLGSGGTYHVVVFGNAVLSGGIAGFWDGSEAAIAAGSPSSVVKRGSGYLSLSGPLSDVAKVTVEQGVLDLSANDDLAGGGALVMAGGTLKLGRTTQSVSDLEIRGGLIHSEEEGEIKVADQFAETPTMKLIRASVDASATLDTSIRELNTSTKLLKTGSGVLALYRENDFSSGVELNAGIVEVGTQLALGGAAILWKGGTLRANSSAQDIANPVRVQSADVIQIGGPSAGDLTFSGSFDLGLKAALNVISKTEFSGVVSGGSLELVGPGSLILSGTNTFVGRTIVSKGMLRVGQGGLNATSQVEVVGARLQLVDFNPAAPMRVSAGGLAQFSESVSGSGSIVLEGGTLQAGAGVSQVLRPVNVQGGVMSVIAGGASTFVGHTQVSAGSSLKVQGVVETQSLMLGGELLIPEGVKLTTGSLHAAVGSKLTWDLRSPGGEAMEVTGNGKVEASNLGVSIPTQSLTDLIRKILPSSGRALVGTGQSAVVGTLISASGDVDMPTNFEAGSATLRFRLNKQGGDGVVLTVDRSTISKVMKSARSGSFLAALDAVNAAANEVTAPAGAAPIASAAAAGTAASAAANPVAPPSLLSLLRAIERLQSAEQIRAMLSPLDGGRGYADLTTVYGLEGLASSSPLDAHLDGLASADFMGSAVSLGVRANPLTPVANNDESYLASSAGRAVHSEAWVAGYGLSSRLSADSVREYGTVSASGGGGVFGLERRYGDLRVGAIVISGQSTSRVSDPEIRIETEHWSVGGYGSVRFGRVTVDSSALFGMSSRESERQLFGETAKADFKTKDWQLALGLSVNLAQAGSGWEISPVLRLKYLRSDQDGFDEQGSVAPVSSEPMVTDRLFSRVGLRLGRHSQLTPNFGFGVFGAAYWLHDFTARGPEMRFKLAGVPYRARARDSEPDLLQFNMGVGASLFQSWTLNLAAQRDIGAERVQQTGVLSVGFRF